jgi:putative tricarboxylic transport membrane protein
LGTSAQGSQSVLLPLIILFCIIGVYSINNSFFDVGVMMFFGVLGYLMKRFAYEGAPMILAFVLSPMLENALRQSLIMSHGSFSIFFTRPISWRYPFVEFMNGQFQKRGMVADRICAN